METTAIQSVQDAQETIVALANIKPSGLNPRKHFDEASLNELADSIRQKGVLQPIGLRPTAEAGLYEIIFGERRYRASLLAGMESIKAKIFDVSDDNAAQELAVTENLQRKDVTPIEEANAYQRLIDSGLHDVKSLAVQFGKTEAYIRTRLKFTALIPEIASLLETDEITVSVATEISRYGEDIQHEVYDKHLKDGVMYNSWRGLKAADVAKRIERDFTTELRYYKFDKTLCASCPHNTNNLLLFCEGGCGNCANRTCLKEMNTSHIVNKAVELLEQNPTASICRDAYRSDDDVVERLVSLGFEVETLSVRTDDFPTAPEEPQSEEYESAEEFAEAYDDYKQQMTEYTQECEEISHRLETGEISLYVEIGQIDASLCYVDNATAQSVANGMKSEPVLTPIEKLEKQDVRNKEIAVEKTIEDTKKRILDVDMSDRKFGADEDKMIYFFLLSSVRKENFPSLGIEGDHSPYLSEEEKLSIIANLSAKEKAVIRRDYLISNFKNACRTNAISTLLIDFAKKHMPEEFAEIENGHNETYEKRHQRIEEKKAVLSVKEKANDASAEADAPRQDVEVAEADVQDPGNQEENNITADVTATTAEVAA